MTKEENREEHEMITELERKDRKIQDLDHGELEDACETIIRKNTVLKLQESQQQEREVYGEQELKKRKKKTRKKKIKEESMEKMRDMEF